MTKRITLRQVATHAGVSPTTVSNVIRGWPHISTDTRQKVENAIEELGYVPHPIAQGLRTGRTHVIGFIVPDLANPHFAAMVSTTEAIAQEHGYNVLIFNSHDDELLETNCLNQVVNRWVDGLIIVQAANATTTTQTLKTITNIPILAMDRIPADFDGPTAKIDNTQAAKLAIQHLYDLGHRKIAHLTGPIGALPARERLEGYHNFLDEFGIRARYTSTHEGTWGAESGYMAMKHLLQGYDHPTAIFASNDSMAIGALHALHEHGLRVPEDVSVVGVDDIELAKHLHPPLTTIRQPIDRMARVGIDLLLKLIEDRENIQLNQSYHVFSPELVVRQSTAATQP